MADEASKLGVKVFHRRDRVALGRAHPE